MNYTPLNKDEYKYKQWLEIQAAVKEEEDYCLKNGEKFKKFEFIKEEFGVTKSAYQRWRKEYEGGFEASINELSTEIVKTGAAKQKFQDKNRILQKENRETYRMVNAMQELFGEIQDAIPLYKPVEFKQFVKKDGDKVVLILPIHDVHLNELVKPHDALGMNEYNFTIASQRIQMLIHEAKQLGELYGAQDILVAFCGDMFNSMRRYDEMLRKANILSHALLIGQRIFVQALQDLATVFNVSIISLVGNESRIEANQLDSGYSATDPHHSMDFLLHFFLKESLKDQKNINFIAYPENGLEIVVNINGSNVLFRHGHMKGSKDQLIAKYSRTGTIINYIVQGHIHTPKNEDMISQGGGMVGGNAYSTFKIHAMADASQNILISKNNGKKSWINPMNVNLQSYHGFKGYEVPKDSEIFGEQKSKDKGKDNTTVVKIII